MTATTGAGRLGTGFAELRPLDQPSGQVRAWDPNLRPQFTQQWNVFGEYLLTPSTSANIGYVGHKATHLVAPEDFNQPLPGVGPATNASGVVIWPDAQSRRPLYGVLPLVNAASGTDSPGVSNYNGLQASVRQRAGPAESRPEGQHQERRRALGPSLRQCLGKLGAG